MPNPPKPSPPDAEVRLNAAVHECFATPSGIEVLKWLRRITIESVGGPDITNDQLRHIEGQRFIVGVLEQRRALHLKHQKDSLNVDRPQPLANIHARRRRLTRADIDPA